MVSEIRIVATLMGDRVPITGRDFFLETFWGGGNVLDLDLTIGYISVSTS